MMIPVALRNILNKLNYLSMIEKDKKPNMYNFTFSDAKSYMGAMYRMIKGESWRSMITEINLIIDQSIGAIDEYNKSEYCYLLIIGLARARNGILNLYTTYNGRPDVLSSLTTIISNIDVQLEPHSELLQKHSVNLIKNFYIENLNSE